MRNFMCNSFKYLCIFFFCLLLAGCSSKNNDKQNNSLISTSDDKLIYEETISPNKEFSTSEDEIVNYIIQIYQNEKNAIIVNAKSNSELIENMQYKLDYDKPISDTDINIKWTTLMGDIEYSEENQLAIAIVSISSDNQIFSERKVNFAKKAIDIITDTIKTKEK